MPQMDFLVRASVSVASLNLREILLLDRIGMMTPLIGAAGVGPMIVLIPFSTNHIPIGGVLPTESFRLNLAVGNGKWTAADGCRFFNIARGSALESAACLDVLVAKRKMDPNQAAEGKSILIEIVSMLAGLIRSNSEDRKV